MAVRTRVEFLDREFLLDTSGADGAQVLAQFAREQRDEAIAINRASTGHEPRYDTFVDGARSDRLESVRPDGVIVFEFDVGSDVVRYCYDLLILHSPILTGAYQRSHSIYADGVEVETPDRTGTDAQHATRAVLGDQLQRRPRVHGHGVPGGSWVRRGLAGSTAPGHVCRRAGSGVCLRSAPR